MPQHSSIRFASEVEEHSSTSPAGSQVPKKRTVSHLSHNSAHSPRYSKNSVVPTISDPKPVKSLDTFLNHDGERDFSMGAQGTSGTTLATNVYAKSFTVPFLTHIEEDVVENDSFATRLRLQLAHTIFSQKFEMGVGIVIIVNFLVIALETDARARKDNAGPDTSEHDAAQDMLSVIAIIHLIFSIVYTVECGMRMYVLRCNFFNHAWNNFDFFMVVTGILAEVLEKASFKGLDGLRTLRTIRMLRASRVLVSFDELYSLVSGLTHAMKALMWAAILMLMVLTMWSIIAVEYVKPLMVDIAANNGFGTCSWCPSAFDSVLLSNLSFFQIISGDGWSHVARPLIEQHAWTALLFIAVIFSMVFGLLNLIVAVIVDSASQAREADIMSMASKKDSQRAAAWHCFHEMVGELDSDGDGQISIDELREALLSGEHMGQLGAYLTTMGIELSDLDMVFELLDSDGDGSLTHHEFTHQLYQMKTQELPITMCYVRHSVKQLHNELEDVAKSIQSKLDQMLSQPCDSVESKLIMSSSLSEPTEENKTKGSRFLRVLEEPMDGQDSGGKGRPDRVSLFRGKPAPKVRIPRNSSAVMKPVSTLKGGSGGVSAREVGNSSKKSDGRSARVTETSETSSQDDATSFRPTLPGISSSEDVEGCLD